MRKRTATPFPCAVRFALLCMYLRRPEDAVNQPDQPIRPVPETVCGVLNGSFYHQSFVTLHKIYPLYRNIHCNLRTSDFQAVIMELEAAGKAKSTCEKVVQLFSQLSKWAIREGIASTNYAQFVSVKAKQKKTRTPFTVEQVRAIGAAKHPAALVAVLLLATGCRPNELFSVKLEDCHDGYFISGSKTEAGRNRVIPVSPFGLDTYRRLVAAAAAAGGKKLIDGYPGNRSAANYAKRDWKELMDEVGIAGMTPYNCRHTYATMAVQAGVKPEILQKILGHADYSTTVDVYTHMNLAEILEGGRQVAVWTELGQIEK